MSDDGILHLCISAHLTSSTALWKLLKYSIKRKCRELNQKSILQRLAGHGPLGQIQNRTHIVPICDPYGFADVGTTWNCVANPIPVPYGVPI